MLHRKKATFVAAVTMAIVAAGGVSAKTLSISFTNNASGGDIFFTPIFTAVHTGSFDTFDTDATASAALEALAEDGDVGGLVADANAFDAVAGQSARAGVIFGTDGASGAFNGGMSGPPLLEPGETSSVEVDVNGIAGFGPGYLSFLSMILPSNDFFIGNDNPLGLQIFDSNGVFLDTGKGYIEIDVLYNAVYDAGTELNADGSDGILENSPFAVGSAQGPGTANVGPDENGVVRNVAATAGLNLSNLIGAQTPGGFIGAVPSGAAGNNVLGQFRIALVQDVAPIPLPAAAPLLLAALGGLTLLGRRRKKQPL
jgi:hypothetical protein